MVEGSSTGQGDDHDRFELNYVLSPMDCALACLLAYARVRRIFVMATVFFAVFLAAALFEAGRLGVLDRLASGPLAGAVISGLPVVAVILVVSPIAQAILTAIIVSFTSAEKRTLRLAISREGVTGENSVGQYNYKWTGFTRLREFRRRAFIMLNNGASIVLPRHALTDSVQWEPMLALVRKQLGAAHGQKGNEAS